MKEVLLSILDILDDNCSYNEYTVLICNFVDLNYDKVTKTELNKMLTSSDDAILLYFGNNSTLAIEGYLTSSILFPDNTSCKDIILRNIKITCFLE